jgi:hypothetical protein
MPITKIDGHHIMLFAVHGTCTSEEHGSLQIQVASSHLNPTNLK